MWMIDVPRRVLAGVVGVANNLGPLGITLCPFSCLLLLPIIYLYLGTNEEEVEFSPTVGAATLELEC